MSIAGYRGVNLGQIHTHTHRNTTPGGHTIHLHRRTHSALFTGLKAARLGTAASRGSHTALLRHRPEGAACRQAAGTAHRRASPWRRSAPAAAAAAAPRAAHGSERCVCWLLSGIYTSSGTRFTVCGALLACVLMYSFSVPGSYPPYGVHQVKWRRGGRGGQQCHVLAFSADQCYYTGNSNSGIL